MTLYTYYDLNARMLPADECNVSSCKREDYPKCSVPKFTYDNLHVTVTHEE